MSADLDWQADLRRYPPRPFFKEQSIWAIWIYRLGRRNDRRRKSIWKRLVDKLYWPTFHLIETVTGIGITKMVAIGPGLRIWHFGSIFIHPRVVIGANCTLRQGVTIGERHAGGGVPRLGDNVDVGAYAQILGEVRVGNNCRIGAMSLVLTDIPDGATAVGIPARVVRTRREQDALAVVVA